MLCRRGRFSTFPRSRKFWLGTRVLNPIGTEYIMTEEAKGEMINDVWPKMDLRSKLSVIKDLVEVQRKLLSINFTR